MNLSSPGLASWQQQLSHVHNLIQWQKRQLPQIFTVKHVKRDGVGERARAQAKPRPPYSEPLLKSLGTPQALQNGVGFCTACSDILSLFTFSTYRMPGWLQRPADTAVFAQLQLQYHPINVTVLLRHVATPSQGILGQGSRKFTILLCERSLTSCSYKNPEIWLLLST
jgi:hypothetical protein